MGSRKASGSAIGQTIGEPRDLERFGRQLGSVANAPFENRQVTLDQEADAVVADMIALGAVFTLAGESAWTWEPRPPDMRDAIRARWKIVESTRPGMQGAMVRAINRAYGGSDWHAKSA